MRASRTILILCVSIALMKCGSSTLPFTPLKKPTSISQPSTELLFQNEETRLLYVADMFTQSLVVVDVLREELVDTAEEDDFDFSPIPVGGEPVAVAMDNSTDPHRVFVADQINKRIFAYRPGTINQGEKLIPYLPVSLATTVRGISSRPMFKDEGADSSPTMTNITVNSTKTQNESWRVKFVGDGEYEVTGTKSGTQSKHAIEGKTYSTDDGGVSFFISPGGEETTDNDSFFFGTMTTKPLEISSTPVDLLIHDEKMYILTKDTPSIIVYDLDSLNVDTTIALPDIAAIPLKMSFSGNEIYVSNAASGDIYSFNIDTQIFTTISTGIVGGIKFVGVDDRRLYLVRATESSVSIWNLDTSEIEKTFGFSDFGNSFIFAENESRRMGLVPNTSGNVDVIDLDDRLRFDTDTNSITVFESVEFFDVSPESKPQLISVNTKVGVTLNESWQMTYEGTVGDLSAIDGSLAGNQLTIAGVDFETEGAKAGDIIVISNVDREYEVASVDGPTTLTLTTTPSTQGSIQFSVLANGEYIVAGSKSGVQKNRVTPGVTYSSDDGQISLKTRPSFEAPESRGDFFSFLTLDTIDPIVVTNQAMAVDGVSIVRTSDRRPFAYILEQTFGQIAILDLVNYDVHKIF